MDATAILEFLADSGDRSAGDADLVAQALPDDTRRLLVACGILHASRRHQTVMFTRRGRGVAVDAARLRRRTTTSPSQT